MREKEGTRRKNFGYSQYYWLGCDVMWLLSLAEEEGLPAHLRAGWMGCVLHHFLTMNQSSPFTN